MDLIHLSSLNGKPQPLVVDVTADGVSVAEALFGFHVSYFSVWSDKKMTPQNNYTHGWILRWCFKSMLFGVVCWEDIVVMNVVMN